MKQLNSIRFIFILILCVVLTSCGDDDDPVVCNTIAVLEGNNQLGVPGEPMPAPLQVKVTNNSGQAVVDAQVSWEVVEGGGSVSASTSKTNAQGIAETNWVYGQEDGKVRATVTNPSECTASTVDFTATKAQLTLIQDGSNSKPKRLRSTGTCYEYDYFIKYDSNLDLSKYYVDVKGEYQFGNETKTTTYFKQGILDQENKTLSFMDCFAFESETYVDDWFTVALYKQSDVQNGKIVAGSVPVVISNRMGPIRTTKPEGAPRLEAGKSFRAAQRGS